MELAGSNYLYTLAMVSISYVGFTALILIFRQSMGGRMTVLDGFIIRNQLQLGFMAMTSSLLPPLLALFGLRPTTIWQIASGIVAIVLGLWVATFPSRRRAASPVAIRPPIWAGLAFLGVMDLILLSNIVGRWGEFSTGVYCLGVTGILFGCILFFLFSLILFFGPHPIDHQVDLPGATTKRGWARGKGGR